jgi:hypothetical protein
VTIARQQAAQSGLSKRLPELNNGCKNLNLENRKENRNALDYSGHSFRQMPLISKKCVFIAKNPTRAAIYFSALYVEG